MRLEDRLGRGYTLSDEGIWTADPAEGSERRQRTLTKECGPDSEATARQPGHFPLPYQAQAQAARQLFGLTVVSEEIPDDPEDAAPPGAED
jgi:hypothetical protein